MLFSRYLLSVGLPFEKWLAFLADMSQSERQPEKFLRESCAGLGKLPWVTGGSWRSASYSGEFGKPSKNSVEYADQELQLCVYTQFNLSPALVWHFHLLGQMLGEFYMAKLREQKLQQQSYLQAVYETGARMTHDVKNLLQSLNVLCVAAEQESQGSNELQALMRRQLPVIASRLQQTLEKLRAPAAVTETIDMVPARSWWQALQRSHYADQNIEFREGGIGDQTLLPNDLFDSAADNLIQNAVNKRKLQGNFAIVVSFSCGENAILEVCDAGRPMAAETARELLRGPVHSDSGLGIGLYQVARQAEASGFALTLAHNADGKVAFVLFGATGPAAEPPAA
jgi:signal transduction histidine kinase